MTNASAKPTKTLLHACCGPCSLEPVRILREEGVEPVVFYANSNIHPADEYARRRDALAGWAARQGLAVVEAPYDPASWEDAVGRVGDAARERFGVIVHEAQPARPGNEGPETARRATIDADGKPGAASADGAGEAGGASEADARNAGADAAERARQARCRACYRLRFEEAAAYAAAHGFDALGTTLSVSPYQYTAVIHEELARACARAGIAARFDDWRPYYDEATRRSREEGLYRQNYCGCRFSDEEAAAERALRKAARAAKRAAERDAHAAEHAAAEEQRAARRAEKEAYAAKRARQRAALKALRAQGGAASGDDPAKPDAR